MSRHISKAFLVFMLTCIPTQTLPMECLAKCLLCCLGLDEQKINDAASHHDDYDQETIEKLSAALARAQQPHDQEPTGWEKSVNPEAEKK